MLHSLEYDISLVMILDQEFYTIDLNPLPSFP
jgi:hypothetical protein